MLENIKKKKIQTLFLPGPRDSCPSAHPAWITCWHMPVSVLNRAAWASWRDQRNMIERDHAPRPVPLTPSNPLAHSTRCIWHKRRAESPRRERWAAEGTSHHNSPEPGGVCEVVSKSWNCAHTSSPRHFRGLEKSRILLAFPEHQLCEMPLACTQPATCANRERLKL